MADWKDAFAAKTEDTAPDFLNDLLFEYDTSGTVIAKVKPATLLWKKGSDVASAGTVTLGDGVYFFITGTTTITDIDFTSDQAGRRAWLKFSGILTLTNGANLILPTGANITTAAGDTMCIMSEGSDVIRVLVYQRADGTALVGGGSFQPLDSDLTTIAGLTATTDNFIQSKSSAWASRTVAQVNADLQGTGLITDAAGFRTIPQNSQSAAYTTVAADSGKHILHPAADTNARTFTIDSNANVAYPVGTAITFINETSQVVTIAITSDTLTLAGTTTTGSRSLAQNGVATAIKITSTKWIISGTGLS
jgi:hypothetical protein